MIQKINPEDGDFLRYVPDELLNEPQKAKKQQSLQKENTRLNDMRYEHAVETGNTERVAQMLKDRAAEQGYTQNSDWRMKHRAPTENAAGGVPLTEAGTVWGKDIYTGNAEQYYGEGYPFDRKAIRAIQSVNGKPDAMITVYRAVPSNVKDTHIRNGDWITLTPEYAKMHGNRELNGVYRVISEKVPASTAFVNGGSIHEFGYSNGQEEGYKNAVGNAKLENTATYHDNGTLIPLSQRFDENNPDKRYSRGSSFDELVQRIRNSNLPKAQQNELIRYNELTESQKPAAEKIPEKLKMPQLAEEGKADPEKSTENDWNSYMDALARDENEAGEPNCAPPGKTGERQERNDGGRLPAAEGGSPPFFRNRREPGSRLPQPKTLRGDAGLFRGAAGGEKNPAAGRPLTASAAFGRTASSRCPTRGRRCRSGGPEAGTFPPGKRRDSP